ncbi:MAG: hypothetical protein Q9Q13_11615 [Acidobacteriota bacterium]|nr:hypothetical protein [Acidobacteriota bacterium]
MGSPKTPVRIESLRTAARCAALAGRCGEGLKWSRRAIALSRELALPALRGAALLDQPELYLRQGNRSEAGALRRRGRLVLRRCTADPRWDTTLPLHGVLSLCRPPA